MKFNCIKFGKRDIPDSYNGVFDKLAHDALKLLGKDTITGLYVLCNSDDFNKTADSELTQLKMRINLLGISVEEMVLYWYLVLYKEYVRKGMQRTAPFHIQMKNEIKSLIGKVGSGII